MKKYGSWISEPWQKYKVGVYMIECKTTKDRYIGSSSNCIHQRLCGHLYDLRRGKHPNQILQRAFTKYGEESFKAYTWVETDSESAKWEEQYWITSVEPKYNISTQVHGLGYYRLSPEHKEKIRQSNRGQKRSSETKAKIKAARATQIIPQEVLDRRAASLRKSVSIPVGCSNGKVYKSILDAHKDTDIPYATIKRYAQGLKPSTAKYDITFWFATDRTDRPRKDT